MEVFLTIIILIAIILWIFRVRRKASNGQVEFEGNSFERIIHNSEVLISSNLSKIKKTAQKSIGKSYLTGCSWILVNNNESDNIIYTFRTNNELLITKNGFVDRLNYELIIDNNSILITHNEIIEHYNIINIYDDFLFINKLSTNSILVFANQTKFKDMIKSEIKKQAISYCQFETN